MKNNDLFKNKVYQRKIEQHYGDCVKCCFCTLFDKKYEDVPNFIELGSEEFYSFENALKEEGYKIGHSLYNYIYQKYLVFPIESCFEDKEFKADALISSQTLKIAGGVPIQGHKIMFASVFSLDYYKNNISIPMQTKHLVLCDENANIVFDPNPHYQKIIRYPFAELIGYSGIDEIWELEKIRDYEK